VAYFNVVGDLAEYGYEGEFLSRASSSTPVVVPYEWLLPDGTIAAVSLAHPLKLYDRYDGGVTSQTRYGLTADDLRVPTVR